MSQWPTGTINGVLTINTVAGNRILAAGIFRKEDIHGHTEGLGLEPKKDDKSDPGCQTTTIWTMQTSDAFSWEE